MRKHEAANTTLLQYINWLSIILFDLPAAQLELVEIFGDNAALKYTSQTNLFHNPA